MVYADYNGSSTPHPEVIKYLQGRLENGPFANPNSIHRRGQQINRAIEKCRRTCAEILGAQKNQVIFNSGATEGINHIFHSLLDRPIDKKNTIIISEIEHAAVYKAALYWETKGYKLQYASVDKTGRLDLEKFTELIEQNQESLALVSVMAANNETGVIQPIKEIGEICAKAQAPFFSDTTQLITKDSFNFAELPMDYAVTSSHKIGGLIGAGMILVKNPETLTGHILGGGQENGFRGGTQNYIAIETMAVALTEFKKEQDKLIEQTKIREEFESHICKQYPDCVVIGKEVPRLAGTTLISYPGVHGQAVQIELESQDIFVSTSSACSDNEPATSRVLKSMGIDDRIGRGVVRISTCYLGCDEAYKKIQTGLENAYNKLVKIQS